MPNWQSFSLRLLACLGVLLGPFALANSARADTWHEPKVRVEWAFKLGAVSFALEKCKFEKGKRFAEMETNARDIPHTKGMRTAQDGREQMMILDGPDLATLCGTAWRFFGQDGRDLGDVLAIPKAPPAP